MGFLSKIVKKVTKVAGLDLDAKAPEVAQPAAAVVEPPKVDTETDDTKETESTKKKVASGGKKALTVARASKGGINI